MDARAYLEHLTDTDVAQLVEVSKTGDVSGLREFLDEDSSRLRGLLASDQLYDALFGSGHDEALLRASPFLIFAVLISRAHADLKQANFVDEWLGPARRVPVFEVEPLQVFSGDLTHQLFLAEVLASYTRVASGSFWVHTPRGWQRRRYSELDLMRLVEMLDIVPESQRPGVLRRLGDLTLFLTGVFPDFSGARMFRPIARRRLESAVMADQAAPGKHADPADMGALDFLELIGSSSYRQASIAAEAAAGSSGALRDMAGGFGQARRVLNFVTDRYLFPFREQWFAAGHG
jgi:hypothetical protein